MTRHAICEFEDFLKKLHGKKRKKEKKKKKASVLNMLLKYVTTKVKMLTWAQIQRENTNFTLFAFMFMCWDIWNIPGQVFLERKRSALHTGTRGFPDDY